MLHGKFGLQSLCLVLLFLLWSQASMAGPSGEQVASGSAAITRSSASTLIQQFTDKAIINWQNFGNNANELVRFIQPSSSSATLNRVLGADPSRILGTLTANGQVFLINPNGILFGPTAVVNVGSLVASTLSIQDKDFLNGIYKFSQPTGYSPSFVVNQGSIKAADGGAVVLLAPLVSNEGKIAAGSGKVGLAGTSEATLNIDGAGLVNFVLPNPDAVPKNVAITADALTDLILQSVNNKALVKAGAVQKDANGNVRLIASEGLAIHGGTIQVNGSAHANAGSVVVNSTQATVLTSGSLIEANGQGANSNGGNVRVLSLGRAGFYTGALIEAKGGAAGDGGNVEVSDKTGGFISGRVDTTATAGKPGMYLIDPDVTEIVNGNDCHSDTGGCSESPPDDTFVNSSTITGAAGSVTIASTKAIILDNFGGTTLTVGGNNSLTLTTQTGNITFENIRDTLAATGGGALTLQAGTTTGSGGSATLGNLSTVSGPISVTADGTLNILGSISSIAANNAGGNAASGAVSLTAKNGSIFINNQMVQSESFVSGGNGTSISGPVTLTAGADINVTGNSILQSSANGDTGASRSGTLSMNAGNNLTINGGSLVGSFSQNNGPNGAVSGDVNATANNNVLIVGGSALATTAQSVLGNTQSGNLTVTATRGLITLDSVSVLTAVYSTGPNSFGNATSGSASLTAGTDITIRNFSDVGTATVTDKGSGLGGNVSLTANNGSITIDNSRVGSTAFTDLNGNFFGGNQMVGTGNVTLNASGAINGLNGEIVLGSTLTLTASRIADPNNPLNMDARSLSASANSGGIFLRNWPKGVFMNGIAALPSLTLTNVTTQGSGNDVNISNTQGDLNIGSISSGGNVTLSTAGNMNGSSGISISGNAATLTAGAGVGSSSNPLNMSVTTLNAAANNGGINISNSGALTLGSIAAHGSGHELNISNAGGNLFVGTVSSDGGINLFAMKGSILDNTNGAGMNLTAGAASTLIAGNGVIGTLSDPLRATVTHGTLKVAAGSRLNGISVDMNGSVSPVNTIGLAPNTLVVTTGEGFWNGQCVFNCPPPPGAVSQTPAAINVNFGQLNPSVLGLGAFNPFPSVAGIVLNLWDILLKSPASVAYTPSGAIVYLLP